MAEMRTRTSLNLAQEGVPGGERGAGVAAPQAQPRRVGQVPRLARARRRHVHHPRPRQPRLPEPVRQLAGSLIRRSLMRAACEVAAAAAATTT